MKISCGVDASVGGLGCVSCSVLVCGALFSEGGSICGGVISALGGSVLGGVSSNISTSIFLKL